MRMTWIALIGAAIVGLYAIVFAGDRADPQQSAGGQPAREIERPAAPPSY
jgi:hypothetical protein